MLRTHRKVTFICKRQTLTGAARKLSLLSPTAQPSPADVLRIHRSASQQHPHHRGHSSPPSSLPSAPRRPPRWRSVSRQPHTALETLHYRSLSPHYMEQDPAFPPLLFSILTAGLSPTRAMEVQSDRVSTAADEPCINKQVKLNIKLRISSMRRSRSDSEIYESPPSPPSTSRHSLPPTSTPRRRLEDFSLPPLQISKARPSIAIDLLPNIPPTPEAMLNPPLNPFTLLCPACHTLRPRIAKGQATAVCRACLTAFKSTERTCKSSHRLGSVLTSFPPLVAGESSESEEEDTNAEAGAGSRKLSIVGGITRVFGMLRGGAAKSRREVRVVRRAGGIMEVVRVEAGLRHGRYSRSRRLLETDK
ncbi:hypothetical protein PSPO01_01852 [Paraphaeosphaeria sporulosa]